MDRGEGGTGAPSAVCKTVADALSRLLLRVVKRLQRVPAGVGRRRGVGERWSSLVAGRARGRWSQDWGRSPGTGERMPGKWEKR